MRHPEGLAFFSSTPVFVVGLVLVIAAGILCWLAWQRSGYRRGTGLLELLRFVLVCLVVVTLNQPEWLELEPPYQRPTLAVLWDKSDSMDTRDVMDAKRPAEKPETRAVAIKPLLAESVWKPDDRDLNVVFEPFSSNLERPDEGTDLNAGLTHILDNYGSLQGVVLLTDGDWNEGKPPIEAATRYRMKNVPVFAVGVGSRTALPDVALVSMDATTYGVLQKPLRIPFVVRSTLGQAREIAVNLEVSGGETVTKIVSVPAMGSVQETLVWTPKEEGEFTLTMTVPEDPEELVADNNSISAPIVIRREALHVLIIESYPRWEYRYLRNALERDPGVTVSCLLFHPGLGKHGGGRGYLKKFPTTDTLSKFDVVFLGDVGVGPKQLTEQQLSDLKQLVSAQASGLVFLPGYGGHQETLTDGPLADLYPVVLDPAFRQGVGSSAAGHFSLTEAGHRSLLTRLAETDEENSEIWRTLPGFHWYAGIQRAKAGTQTLAVHRSAATDSGRVPLIVTKTYGTGKVLFMGTDGAWRWREGVEDKYHYRFWGQVARWMAYQRKMAQGESIRLFYSPDRPRVGDVITVNVNVMDDEGAPMEDGTVVVQALSESGTTKTIRLKAGGADSWGLFTGSFAPKEAGVYRLMASCSETGASLDTDLSVRGINKERRGRPARFDVLDEISRVSKGTLVDLSTLDRLLDHLAALPEPDPTVHRTRIWAHPAWAGMLILLLSVFWVGRKIIGQI